MPDTAGNSPAVLLAAHPKLALPACLRVGGFLFVARNGLSRCQPLPATWLVRNGVYGDLVGIRGLDLRVLRP